MSLCVAANQPIRQEQHFWCVYTRPSQDSAQALLCKHLSTLHRDSGSPAQSVPGAYAIPATAVQASKALMCSCRAFLAVPNVATSVTASCAALQSDTGVFSTLVESKSTPETALLPYCIQMKIGLCQPCLKVCLLNAILVIPYLWNLVPNLLSSMLIG